MDFLLLAFLVGGIVAGALLPENRTFARISSAVQNVLLFALIFFMGFSIGNNKELLANLGTLGLKALVFAVLCAVGSFLATTGIFALLRRRKGE